MMFCLFISFKLFYFSGYIPFNRGKNGDLADFRFWIFTVIPVL